VGRALERMASMKIRQQVLYLWLAEGDLATPVVGWAFHDGAEGKGPDLPEGKPPYATGVAALVDGWNLLQSPPPNNVEPMQAYETGGLVNEFVFERRVEFET
jgi:hypothetical protein